MILFLNLTNVKLNLKMKMMKLQYLNGLKIIKEEQDGKMKSKEIIEIYSRMTAEKYGVSYEDVELEVFQKKKGQKKLSSFILY